MLHELEGEVDVERHSFASVVDGANVGFFRNRRSARIYGAAAPRDAARSEVYLTTVKGPRRSLERHELDAKYEPVEPADARAWWDAEYANTPAAEPRRFYLLSGAIFPIYDKVMGSSGIQCVKIARAVLVDGQALVGLNLSPTDVPSVKQRLGIGAPLGEASAADILALLTGGAVIELDNGWRLATARIAGDEVIELVLCGVAANRSELLGYGLSEEIVSYKRRWFAPLDDAAAVLSRFIVKRRPVKDLTVPDEAE